MVVSFEILLFFVWCLHLWLCPFTKVEESFNTQAMHDMLFHQLNTSDYDHLEFPGVVPRTFFGPLIVSVLAYPFGQLLHWLQLTKYYWLILVRMTLGFLVFLCFRFYVKSVRRVFGGSVAVWLLMITCSQFHLNFYATRPLPNIFALSLVLCVYGFLLNNHNVKAVWCAVFSVVVFRSELVLLYAPLFLYVLLERQLRLVEAIINGFCAFMVSLALTVPLDSLLWRSLLWPEGAVWYYNVILNKSSNWGTSPFLWYFTSALPRALLSSLILAIFGIFLNTRIRNLTISATLFILLYSFLPHKELRFIIYTFPIFNLSSAYVCHRIARLWNRSYIWKSAYFACVAHLALNALATSIFLYISSNNYPGGSAMLQLHEIKSSSSPLRIHIDVYTAQTGVSRFLHMNSLWEYNKTETLKENDPELLNFDCLFIGGNDSEKSAAKFLESSHRLAVSVKSFHRISRPVFSSSAPFVSIDVQWRNSVLVFCRS